MCKPHLLLKRVVSAFFYSHSVLEACRHSSPLAYVTKVGRCFQAMRSTERSRRVAESVSVSLHNGGSQ
jgi:hypothetical protein